MSIREHSNPWTYCRLVTVCLLIALGSSDPAPASAQSNDLCPLSDEFDDPSTLSQWIRVHEHEGWFADQLETLDIDASFGSALTMMPYTVSWYEDWRGPFLFKEVEGDFAVTTSITVTARDGVSVPSSLYSLGGLLIREPRTVTPATWTPGGENYVFLSLGYGNAVPPSFQHEVKTTVNSVSTLELTPAPGPAAEIQTARLGEYVITLRRPPAGAWNVHRRYWRPDLGAVLQVGMVSYTDWEKCSHFVPFDHNSVTITPPLPSDPSPATPFSPDVLVRFEYVRFQRAALPPHLEGLDLTNAGLVSDAELLAFLGGAANPDPADPCEVSSVSGEGGQTEPGVARMVSGARAVPNPVGGSAGHATTLSFRLHRDARVDVSIFDAAGRRITTLADRPMSAGEVHLSWDAGLDHGDALHAGVYWARIRAFDAVRSRPVGEAVLSIVVLD